MSETHVCGDCGLSVQKMHRYHRDCIAALRTELVEAQQQLQQANGDGIYKANLSRSDYDKILCDAEQQWDDYAQRLEATSNAANEASNRAWAAEQRAEQAEQTHRDCDGLWRGRFDREKEGREQAEAQRDALRAVVRCETPVLAGDGYTCIEWNRASGPVALCPSCAVLASLPAAQETK